MEGIKTWPWQHWAQRRPGERALIEGDAALSWSQLAYQVEQLATAFKTQGLQRGCGVMLRTANSRAAVMAYLALLRCGARLLPVNPQLPQAQLRTLLPSLNIDFMLDLTAEPLPGDRPAELTMAACAMDRSFDPTSVKASAGNLQHRWDSASIATLTLTSGSRGLPKAVAHTFSAHLASAKGVSERLAFTAADAWLLSLPLFHVSGQGILWRWLYAGATLGLSGDRPLHEALAHCSFASLVPAQLWRLLRQPALPAGLKCVLLGGSAIPAALTTLAEARGIACWCGYGMTETASTVTAMRADGSGGVGTALAGHQVTLAADEIRLKSAALGLGYWRNGELLPLADEEGWFATRDRGRWRDGGLQVTGRTDNLFFSAGEGVQPELIEQILLQHPAVSQAFIVPLEDEEYGHRPVALLTTTAPLSDIAGWAKPRLAGFQRPVRWYPLPALGEGGIKLSRKRLAEWVADRQQA
ncbi:o-succinylbenzoate--CoA ligase [Erwinia sp. P6884]|uniref:o-succinylbenzoate--CoA ligase n=1 Tax=Erwinia sp. P6884 TaxID=3141450 RepID=UPI0031864578